MSKFQFPSTGQHVTIMGRTGSGKTQAGAWLLSESAFDEMPYIIIDYKLDELINSIGAIPHSVHDAPPDKPGLYIVQPHIYESEALEHFLWQIHGKGNTGLYFDEGANVARSTATDTILMQGRSKHIPVTILTQRPAYVSRYAFSEASHIITFHLNDRRDRVKVREFFGNYSESKLPDYHAQWYNVNNDCNFILKPVPDADTIRERFTNRLEEMREQQEHHRRQFI